MSRLFFAHWPNAFARSAMASVMDQLPGACGRFVAHLNLHITLVFLGSVTEEQAQCVLNSARNIKVLPTALTLDKLVWWKKSQVVWLAPQKIPDNLVKLEGQLRKLAEQCGIRIVDRPYIPHVTLVRKVNKRVILPEISPVSWGVRDFSLVRSATRSEGASYQVIWTST